MADLKKLRADRAALVKKGREATARWNALDAKTDRSEAEEAEYVKLDAQLDADSEAVTALDAQIEKEERRAARAGAFGAPADRPRAATSGAVDRADLDPRGGFRDLAEMAVAVRNQVAGGIFDQRLAAPTTPMQTDGTAGEGFLVPAEFRAGIWEEVFNGEDLLNAVMIEPTNAAMVNFLKDETTPWGATGIQAYWMAEGGSYTPSREGVKAGTVFLNKLGAFCSASDELLADAPRLASRLTAKAGAAIRHTASEAIMSGDGNARPLGFMNSGALVTVAKETGQAAATLTDQNVLKMLSRLLPRGVSRSFWLVNSDVLPQLGALKIGDLPVWVPPSTGLTGAPGGFLLGRPIVFSEHAKTLGTVGDVCLINPDGYYAIGRGGGGIDFATSIHLYFDTGHQAFRWTFRFGGQPFLSAPVSPKNGSNTKSHFVVLATRA